MPSFVLRKSTLAPRGPFIAEPESVHRVGDRLEPAKNGIFMPEVFRTCRLEHYNKVDVPPVDVQDEVIAYCSPDSSYAVNKRVLDAAKKSIVIGIYDFSADYMKQILLDALKRGVKIKLMLDIDSKDEQKLFDELTDLGVDGVPAPSCASHRVHFFSSSHEKVIVIDDEWSLVQSGNYSQNSIPLNEVDGGDPKHFRSGNRDSGLAIRSPKLAKFFSKILESDMALEINGPEALAAVAQAANVFLVEKAPTKLPIKLFPSKTFKLTKPLRIQPVLSPDNYMAVVPGLLKAARKSVLIEQQYIRGNEDQIAKLLDAIKAARHEAPALDIRIVLGKLFSQKDVERAKKNLELLSSSYNLELGKNIRFIDTTRLVHCHNKMVLIDGKGALVSSQNWSNSAVVNNREAGVWLDHAEICTYFTQIFESDWETGQKKIPPPEPHIVAPESLRAGGFVRVVPADYQEV